MKLHFGWVEHVLDEISGSVKFQTFLLEFGKWKKLFVTLKWTVFWIVIQYGFGLFVWGLLSQYQQFQKVGSLCLYVFAQIQSVKLLSLLRVAKLHHLTHSHFDMVDISYCRLFYLMDYQLLEWVLREFVLVLWVIGSPVLFQEINLVEILIITMVIVTDIKIIAMFKVVIFFVWLEHD